MDHQINVQVPGANLSKVISTLTLTLRAQGHTVKMKSKIWSFFVAAPPLDPPLSAAFAIKMFFRPPLLSRHMLVMNKYYFKPPSKTVDRHNQSNNCHSASHQTWNQCYINSLSASLLFKIFLSFEVGIAHAIANFKWKENTSSLKN